MAVVPRGVNIARVEQALLQRGIASSRLQASSFEKGQAALRAWRRGGRRGADVRARVLLSDPHVVGLSLSEAKALVFLSSLMPYDDFM